MTTVNTTIALAKASELVFVSQNNKLVTDTLKVAQYFGKPHKDVLAKVRSIDCSTEFNERNFSPVDYRDVKGEVRPKYQMTKDGFIFLVMSYTGKRAAEIKERYIEAFNEMEQKLSQPQNEIMPIMPPSSMRFLMCMEKGHVVSTQVIPDDCVVFRTEDIPKLIREPGYFNVDELLSINQAINEQLKLCVKARLI